VLVTDAARALFSSPRFAVRRVEIRAEPILAKELAKRLRLRPGTNLALANTGGIARAVAAVPQVKSVRVYRHWPDRITVEAEARQAAAVSRAGESAVFYDAEGRPFPVPGCWGWELPELAGPGLGATPANSEGVRPAARQLLSCLRVLREQAKTRPRRLRLDSQGRITAELQNRVEVRLGQPRELELKARRLHSALVALAGKGEAEYIDLSSPHGVVWKPREEPLAPRAPSSPSG